LTESKPFLRRSQIRSNASPRIQKIPKRRASVTIHAQTVNTAEQFEVQIIKLEMEKALNLVARVPDNLEFKEQLLKAAVKASRSTDRRGTVSLKP